MTSKRVAFITIGQSPRRDILDEMKPWMGAVQSWEITERGLLDELSPSAIESWAPGTGEARLVSRLRNGSEVVLSKTRVEERLGELLVELSRRHELLVLLCTGKLRRPRLDKGMLIEAQPVVDHGALALAEAMGGASRIGLLLPAKEQIADFHLRPEASELEWLVAHASPYSEPRWEEAARKLEGADLVVMHCMGYNESMRARIAELTGKPTLLARRLLASAIAQLA